MTFGFDSFFDPDPPTSLSDAQALRDALHATVLHIDRLVQRIEALEHDVRALQKAQKPGE